jgi:hypothetical protein
VTGEVLVAASGDSLPISPPPRQPQSKAPTVKPPSGSSSSPAPVTPGLTLPPSATPPSSGSDGGSGGSGGASGAPPLVPKGTPVPVPEGVTPEIEGETATPETEAPVGELAASHGSGASPWAAIGIGLAVTALAAGAPVLLGRRFGW